MAKKLEIGLSLLQLLPHLQTQCVTHLKISRNSFSDNYTRDKRRTFVAEPCVLFESLY